MNPVARALGKVLRLVGISSPDDAAPNLKAKGDPASWCDAAVTKPEGREA